jgi:VanZ family protein
MSPAEPASPKATPVLVGLLRSIGALLLRVPRQWGFVPVLLWAAFLFFLSSRPAPTIGVGGAVGGLVENFGHALLYGVFAVCLALLVPRTRDDRGEWVELRPKTTAAILLFVLLYAASDEWHQSFVPDRDASVYDVITDVVGAASTLACIAALGARQRPGRVLALRFVLGLAACVSAAALATFE